MAASWQSNCFKLNTSRCKSHRSAINHQTLDQFASQNPRKPGPYQPHNSSLLNII